MWILKKRRPKEAYIADHRQVVEIGRAPVEASPAERRARFLEELAAKGVTLDVTAERFPHVIDRLAIAWNDPRRAISAFNELMIDYRGGRRGFPPEVVREINKAFAVYRSFAPKRDACVWDESK